MSEKILYVCYFGLREPLVQTQVLPYIREIKKLDGIKAKLLTFETNPKETWTREQIDSYKKKLAGEHIEWDFLTYHKSPSAPATIFDVLNGAYFIWKLLRREQIKILHARVHVPAMMCAIARKFSSVNPSYFLIFEDFSRKNTPMAGDGKQMVGYINL